MPMDIQINPESVSPWLKADLCSAAHAVRGGLSSATDLLQTALHHADAAACAQVFVRRLDEGAHCVALAVDAARAAHLPLPPLCGLAVAVQDSFDVQGQPTTAASRVLADSAPASRDSTAVARLRQAGAALVGQTNLSEFGSCGIGLNSVYGVPLHPASVRGATARIPGGSASGAAVAVASQAAWAALTSDSFGSARIPAALQGLVAFKSTQALTPRDGMLPLAPSLDTACAITRSVRDAALLHGVLAARTVGLSPRPLRALRLALPTTLMTEGLDGEVGRAFEQALATLRLRGAQIDELPLPLLAQVPALQAGGGLLAAESWAWHRERLQARQDLFDPRVAQRLSRGQAMSAADYIGLLDARTRWAAQMQQALGDYDALLSPTVPMVAPALAPLLQAEARHAAIHTLLLRNPSVVNLLDGCALTLPCEQPGHLPVGLMVWAPAGADERLLSVALTLEAQLTAAQP